MTFIVVTMGGRALGIFIPPLWKRLEAVETVIEAGRSNYMMMEVLGEMEVVRMCPIIRLLIASSAGTLSATSLTTAGLPSATAAVSQF